MRIRDWGTLLDNLHVRYDSKRRGHRLGADRAQRTRRRRARSAAVSVGARGKQRSARLLQGTRRQARRARTGDAAGRGAGSARGRALQAADGVAGPRRAAAKPRLTSALAFDRDPDLLKVTKCRASPRFVSRLSGSLHLGANQGSAGESCHFQQVRRPACSGKAQCVAGGTEESARKSGTIPSTQPLGSQFVDLSAFTEHIPTIDPVGSGQRVARAGSGRQVARAASSRDLSGIGRAPLYIHPRHVLAFTSRPPVADGLGVTEVPLTRPREGSAARRQEERWMHVGNDELECWFLTGSQHLYGEETLRQVAIQSARGRRQARCRA